MQPSLFAAEQWTVSALTTYIRDALESDVRLQDVWVEERFRIFPGRHRDTSISP